MRATPIIPGRLYRVRGAGFDLSIIATHPCAAIVAALPVIGGNCA